MYTPCVAECETPGQLRISRGVRKSVLTPRSRRNAEGGTVSKQYARELSTKPRLFLKIRTFTKIAVRCEEHAEVMAGEEIIREGLSGKEKELSHERIQI